MYEIIVTRLIVGNATKFGTFYVTKYIRDKKERDDDAQARLDGDMNYFKRKSAVQAAFALEEYDPLLGMVYIGGIYRGYI